MEFGLGQCRGGRQLLEIVMILYALLEIAENLGPEHQHYQDSYHWWFGVVDRFGLLGTVQDQRSRSCWADQYSRIKTLQNA